MSTGPYVIVNTYSGEAWRQHMVTGGTERLEFATEPEAHVFVLAERDAEIDITAGEAVVMPLAQYLVEYGT